MSAMSEYGSRSERSYSKLQVLWQWSNVRKLYIAFKFGAGIIYVLHLVIVL